MKKLFAMVAVAAPLAMLASSDAYAINAHLNQFDCDEINGALVCTGKVSGLGNQGDGALVAISDTVACVNRGGNPPPGQQRQSDLVPITCDSNGNCTFTVALLSGCRRNFTAIFGNIVTVIVVNAAGQIILQQNFAI